MCLWLLAACLGATVTSPGGSYYNSYAYPSPIINAIPAIPGPILVPTSAPTTVTTLPTFPPNTFPPNTFPPGQPTQFPPNTFPPGQPTQFPPNTFPPGQPTQFPPNTFPPGQPTQFPPNTFPPGQPTQFPPNTFPPGQPTQFPPNTFPPGQPTQFPGQPTQFPPGQPTPFPTFPPTPGPTLPPNTFPTLPTTTLRPLTPVPGGPTPGITPPPGIIPTQQPFPPFPNIDPRYVTPLPLINEPTIRFGAEEDVVIEAQIDTGVVFPRNKRFVEEDNFKSISNRTKRQANCGCFLPTQCPTTGSNTDGSGLIDWRIVTGGNINQPQNCPSGLRYCCLGSLPQQSCGSRLVSATSYPVTPGQARYGDYPWMAVILTTDNQYVGGATLIDSLHVVTAAHRIINYPTGAGIKIRLGEWDATANYEQYPFRDFSIARVWIHESFNRNNLQNDLAMIRLVGGLPSGTPSIIPICMPVQSQLFDNQRCWVSGWGKDSFGPEGKYQTILKAVDVLVIPPGTCETTFRSTRLGAAFILDRSSFICAGGEINKDSCTGDGGSGLVCETTPGRWTLAGLVTWGLGCASQGIPAAYVNIVNYLPWIQSKQTSS